MFPRLGNTGGGERCGRATVQSVATIEQVLLKATGKQLSKQEILLADCTAACRCVLWEQHVNGAEEDHPQMSGFAKCGQFTTTTSTR